MKYTTALLGLAVPTLAVYQWPNPLVDEIEDLAYLQKGYNARNMSSFLGACSTIANGHQVAAEWVQVPFHDAITHNATSGLSGLDSSIMWETHRPENIGTNFNNTFTTFMNFYNIRATLSDIMSVGAYISVRTCGGPALTLHAGRVDATGQGPCCGPRPQDTLEELQQIFNNAGFTNDEMIAVTACGHTMGGVSGDDFPQITLDPNAFQLFDSTYAVFDNAIVTDFLGDATKNPLVVAANATFHSDYRVFSSDNNATFNALKDPDVFQSTCFNMLNKMYSILVPSTSPLSDPITPIPLKPSNLQLTLNHDSTITFEGKIRVLTTAHASTPLIVTINTVDRNGHPGLPIVTTLGGSAFGLDDSFKFYNFKATLLNGISKFTVNVISVKGKETYDNNGAGFPISDAVIYQSPQSCLSNGKLTVTAAIRHDQSKTVSLNVVTKTPQIGAIAPHLAYQNIPMVLSKSGLTHDYYTASYTADPTQYDTTFDIVSGSASDSFKSTKSVGATCGV